ncbi:CDP-glycerol glycerophosphotransferase family protein [Marinospirillum alkaliphilum]|uniref:CDP-glycerol glycerophosphotransferase family protein n=1 Tax=Marinospirillum alkaliphilum TaxID=148454 RepID=UPI0015A4F956|nr:CDP-glycerol glycerophosphotransferase family protein [Marinospirillum alkaliphilum]
MTAHYQQEEPDWIIFGNNYSELSQLPEKTRTALLYHGIGTKACYYAEDLSHFDVRFTEGPHRQQQLQNLYPQACFIQSGFAKLDPLAPINLPYPQAFKPEQHGLSSNKPTLLYAPTFYPSSIECMPRDWPALLPDCNIIIKPHLNSYLHPNYKAQRKCFQAWSKHNNTYLAPPEELSLLPYMATADLLISEASSALFEFAALNKPVVWLDFLKLRWSYRGPLRFRFEKRMDQTITPYQTLAAHVEKPSQLVKILKAELSNPERLSSERNRTTEELIGTLDGKVSERIVNYLLNN